MTDTSNDIEAILTPGPDAKPEPFYAIMEANAEQAVTGQIWTFNGAIILFQNQADAERLLDALNAQDTAHSYVLRGVTKQHLELIQGIAQQNKVALEKVKGFSADGQIETEPL